MSSSVLRLPQIISPAKFWSFESFLFDADGVIWRETLLLPGAQIIIQQLIDAGKRVLIVTNNSTRDADEHATKCQKMGLTAINADNIVCSSNVLVHQIKKLKASSTNSKLPIYLFGSVGLQNVLNRNGIESFGPGPDVVPADKEFHFDAAADLIDLRPVFAVAAAFDAHISYPKIVKAINYLADPTVPFLCTNEDAVFPGPLRGSRATLVPGAGTVSSVLRYVSGREPMVMGKPSRICWEYICERFPDQINPDRTLMIGDRCDTDILFGQASGLTTLLMLTGVTSMADVERFASQGKDLLVPDFYASTLKQLLLDNGRKE